MTDRVDIKSAADCDDSKQELAFCRLCDTESGGLKHPYHSKEGRAAIELLNRATADSILHHSRFNQYAVGCTLSQGACLISVVLGNLKLMVSAWCGPTSDLSKYTVQVLATIPGHKIRSVRQRYNLFEHGYLYACKSCCCY